MNYSQIINDKMNSDIRSRYATILENEYKVSRDSEAKVVQLPTNKKKLSLKRMFSAAMILLLISAGLFYNFQQEITDPKTMAQQYIAAHEMDDLSSTRSLTSEKITNPEEKFFLAMGMLENESYKQAIDMFQALNTEIQKGEAYYHETKVYLILSLIMNNENKLAKSLFDKLPENSWERTQVQQIIANID